MLGQTTHTFQKYNAQIWDLWVSLFVLFVVDYCKVFCRTYHLRHSMLPRSLLLHAAEKDTIVLHSIDRLVQQGLHLAEGGATTGSL